MAKSISRKKANESTFATWIFTLNQLDMFWKYVLSMYLPVSELNKAKRFFDTLDMDVYKYNMESYSRVLLIKLYLEAKVDHNLTDRAVIETYIKDHDEDGIATELLKDLNWDNNQLDNAEVRVLSKSIAEKLQCSAALSAKPRIDESYRKISESGFYSISDSVEELRKNLSSVVIDMQDAAIAQNGLLQEFRFSSPDSNEKMEVMVEKARRPSQTLYTGIRQLNAILGGGFQSGRLYLFLGNTGGFKSGTLLNMADQIRRFNPQLVDSQQRRKAILYVNLENSIEETLERLYDMWSPLWAPTFAQQTAAKIMQTLHDEGGFAYPDEPGIDIVYRYAQDLSISTDDLYRYMQEYEDQGIEIICVVLDYIKRINSSKPWKEERDRLSNVSKELKSFAEFFQIPVITAQQTNREGNSIIDAAIQEDKSDIARFIGASQIGSCWPIMEDSDWVSIINRELRKSDQKLYLTFKRVKFRGKTDARVADYFNMPFVDERFIRLETDVDKPVSLAIRSLASDLDTDVGFTESRTQERPKIGQDGKLKPKSADEVLKVVGYKGNAKIPMKSVPIDDINRVA